MPTNEQLAANPFPINDLQRTQTKSPGQGRGFSLQLVPETGVEPATYALRMLGQVICINYLRYAWDHTGTLRTSGALIR